MSELRPCPGCRRHVRDARCPFCGAVATRGELPPLPARMSRAMVFGAAEEKKMAEENLERAKTTPMCAPYGAPPSRRRVV